MSLGGSSPKMPKAPDYERLAQLETQGQMDINRQVIAANRVNQYTPWGSIEWSQGGGKASGPTFDQAGFDKAMAAYNANMQQNKGTGWYGHSGNPFAVDYSKTQFAGTSGIKPPNPADFMRAGAGGNSDRWASTMKLNPELQKILDNEWAAKQGAYTELQNYLSDINDSSVIPEAVVRPGMTAQQAIMARLDPTFQTEDERIRTRLYNQGVRPGTEAWDNEMRNFERARNDAYSQAALQGINLDNQARATALAEQALPLNAINSFLSGNSVQQPQFGAYAQMPTAQAPNLIGAGQAQYNAGLDAYNAGQAQSSNFMGGLFGLGGSILGAPMSGGGSIAGALGSALFGF